MLRKIKIFKRVVDFADNKNGAIEIDVISPAGGGHPSHHIWQTCQNDFLKHDMIGY